MTAETLFNQIQSLPLGEKLKLRALLDSQLKRRVESTDEVKFVEPIRLPDPQPSQQWMQQHSQEYGGEWVALDGDRLIAHGENAAEVFAAADADGSYLPLVTYIPPVDTPPFAGV
jgi:Family of unknown function (DUF5678)